MAGGVIGSAALSRAVIARWGGSLPGAAHPFGQAAYVLGISVGGAFLLRRFNRQLSEGFIIGGLVSVVSTVIGSIVPAARVNEYLGAYEATQSLGPATQQMAAQIAPTPQLDAYLDSQPAFENSAW